MITYNYKNQIIFCEFHIFLIEEEKWDTLIS